MSDGLMLPSLAAVGSFTSTPDPSGSARAFARMGYDLQSAISDIIDNSIDAGARHIAIRFLRDDKGIQAVTIADDGEGMNAAELEEAMRFGASKPRENGKLGTFGLGMKSASLSQCRTLTVASCKEKKSSACRWTTEAIEENWRCDRLGESDAANLLTTLGVDWLNHKSGTVVIWERLTDLSIADDDVERFLARMIDALDIHLGLYFHRFISAGRVGISLAAHHLRDGMGIPREVRCYDPFGYAKSGHSLYPKVFLANLPGIGQIAPKAHIWPANAVQLGFRLGRRRPTQCQGFYIYRNNRLIQAGGWNGLLKDSSDPDLVLARVSLDLPDSAIADLVNVSKSRVQLSPAVTEALERAQCGKENLRTFLDAARRVQRESTKGRAEADSLPIVPAEGLPKQARRNLEEMIAPAGEFDAIDFEWAPLPRKQIFELDRYKSRILLNQRYRSKIVGGGRGSRGDAPLFKTLLFLLMEDVAVSDRLSAQRKAWLDRCNEMLWNVVTAL